MGVFLVTLTLWLVLIRYFNLVLDNFLIYLSIRCCPLSATTEFLWIRLLTFIRRYL